MEKKEKKLKRKPVNVYKVLTVLLTAALVVVGGIALRNRIVQNNAQKEYAKLAAQVNRLQNQVKENAVSVPEDTQQETQAPEVTREDFLSSMGIDVPKKDLDWKELSKVNQDIYAWIYIPGTDIDYPVLQHPTDDSYYLNYNMNGTRGYPGCIYSERFNNTEFTDFDTILYGHNMKNDSMFADLHKFEEPEFFEDCPYVYIYTGDKTLVYAVFSAYTTDNAHLMYKYDMTSEKGRGTYLSDMKNNGKKHGRYREEVTVSERGHFLTLSTCVSGQPEHRFLVQAALVNEDAL